MNTKLLLLLYLVLLFSCKNIPKTFEAYKGFKLPSTREIDRQHFDSLPEDNIEKATLEGGMVIHAFVENISSKPTYISEFPKRNGNLITGYRFYFTDQYGFEDLSRKSIPDNHNSDDLFRDFSNPEATPINEILISNISNDLNSKYGTCKEQDTTEILQSQMGTFYQVSTNIRTWAKDGLEIKLYKKSLSDGFLNIHLDYDLSKEYLSENKEYLEKIISESSKF